MRLSEINAGTVADCRVSRMTPEEGGACLHAARCTMRS